MKNTYVSLFTALMLIFYTTTGFAESITLRMALGDPENSEMGIVGNTFKNYVEEHPEGEMHIELFFAGALGPERETVHSVRHGMLDMTCVAVVNLVPFVEELGVLTLPYLFQDIEQVIQGTTGPSHALLNSYAQKGMFRILTWTYTDFRYLSNSKHPITKLEDIKGLKFRTPQNRIMIETYRSWGAIPEPISWSSTFGALQRGLVDGQSYGYIGFRFMKFYDAHQKFITEIHYTYQIQPLIISERIFRKLSPMQQELLLDAGKAAQDAALEYQVQESAKVKEALIAQGVQISQLADEELWRQRAIDRVWPDMAESVGGKKAINTFLQSFEQPEWTP